MKRPMTWPFWAGNDLCSAISINTVMRKTLQRLPGNGHREHGPF